MKDILLRKWGHWFDLIAILTWRGKKREKQKDKAFLNYGVSSIIGGEGREFMKRHRGGGVEKLFPYEGTDNKATPFSNDAKSE